jgi:alkylation response protein AidB-like acyl-CoA dehydrogenase
VYRDVGSVAGAAAAIVTRQFMPVVALSELMQRAREIGPIIADHAEESERRRDLAEASVAALVEAGLHRLSVPVELGGAAMPLSDQLAVIEEVARHDGSAGWCVMIHATSCLLCGQLRESTQRELFAADPGATLCGVFAPQGRATAVDGGQRVTGRWSFASGCRHSAWRLGGVLVDADGRPALRLAIFEAAQTVVHDTWHVAGLKGTGSHDIEVTDAFVPTARVVDPFATPVRDEPLYRMPLFGFLAAEVAAVAVGIAVGAVETFVDLATHKTPAGGKRSLAQRGTIQLAVADATAGVDAGRAYLRDAAGVCERAIERGDLPSLDDRARLRLAAAYAVQAATRAVDRMYEAGGGSALYETSPLQRQFRDIHAATQHIMVAAGIRELVGRHRLGLPVDPRQL